MRPIYVEIDDRMRSYARVLAKERPIEKTSTNDEDGYIGSLGQLAWYKLRYGETGWWEHRNQGGAGEPDDMSDEGPIEVKSSQVRNMETAHLMVKEYYALHNSPAFYILVLFDEAEKDGDERIAYVCGWGTHKQVLAGKFRTGKSSKTGKPWGYYCYCVPRRELHKIIDLPFEIALLKKGRRAANF